MAACKDDESEGIAPTPHTISFDTGKGEESEVLFSIDTHPGNNIVATGDIAGQINLCVIENILGISLIPFPPTLTDSLVRNSVEQALWCLT